MKHRIAKEWARWGREFVVLVVAEHGFPIAIVALGHFLGYWLVLG